MKNESNQIIEVDAQSYLQVFVDCKKCHRAIDATNKLSRHLDEDLTATEIDVEVKCRQCGQRYLVKDIYH
jgi:DNA-directed RNA polymerase subunit RPC12/RpoP